MREIVTSSEAPQPSGHYAQAVKANGFVFVSGQGPYNPQTDRYEANESIEEQTWLTLRALEAVLKAAGTTKENVVRIGVFLKNVADFDRFNAAYAEFFGETKPARTTVGASPVYVDVEIDCVAVMPDS